MRKIVFLVLIGIFAAVAGWIAQRPTFHYLSDLRSEVALNVGESRGHGNLLAIQPELFTFDYQTPDRLRLKLEGYLKRAQDEGLLNDKTVVIFPEHIGTGFLLVGEKPLVYTARDSNEARHWLALGNPLKFTRAWLSSPAGENRFNEALLRMKAWDMAGTYQVLFGTLARTFNVTIIAGSIILPSPSLQDGLLRVGSGRLYNTSLTFGPDGAPLSTLLKRRWRHGAKSTPVIPETLATRAGTVGLILGSDTLQAVPSLSIDALIIPSVNETSQQSLDTALMLTKAQVGLQVFPNGKFWELLVTGQSTLKLNGQPVLKASGTGAKLLNVWL
ncbi:hypothetical protein IQ22_02941 [Pseudomonas duriflava]|uniref:Carbon-nitrogen hydrolase n=1 Tax=Pseudomonas duriflava TaxID=459528 RepID=A0A562Q8R1_9PSED|nr:hypothetical protein [Pseudomonas duriflava]TWI53098.1 hypothetical protein IQ22_02941 [Pseudomonas duriflava]